MGKPDLDYARRVLREEARAVSGLQIGPDFTRAARLILELDESGHGRAIGTGMGKAGLIAQKVVATFASTGTPASFMHPAEAQHGDLGMLTRADLLLAFSNSGETEEVIRLLPAMKKRHVPIVAVTAQRGSTLGQASEAVLELGKIPEPCPLGLAPSASTTAMLAIGDALALCVLKARGFTAQDYARLHPGGSLGRKLMQAKDLMRTGKRLALVKKETSVGETVTSMSQARGGAAVVIDKAGKLVGIFTDGDLRRHMPSNPGLMNDSIGKHMTSPCLHIRETMLVAEAQELMAQRRINALPVVDAKQRVTGVLDIQDLVGWPVL